MLYTDGLVERRHVPVDDGISAAAALIAGHGTQHPDAVADQVMSGMMPAAGFEDDVAVLLYRHPPAPLRIHVTAADSSCLAVIRARLRQWLPQGGIGDRDGTDILIAVGEAAANAYEHGTAGRGDGHEPVQITVTVRAAHALVEATVTDTGSWRSPRAEPDTRGHGIAFMHALMDHVDISTTEHGTTVTMSKEI
jgi:anti-sigma regulatory factor (Ser/Thr protein kinase)